MNNIVEQQNSKDGINLLLAQRLLYSSSKNIFTVRTFLATLIAIVGPVLVGLSNEMSFCVGLITIIYWAIDYFLLEKRESNKRLQAAKVQELFDTKVLSLPWNEIVVGKKPDQEIIANVLDNAKSDDKLIDWYSPKVSEVDICFARFLCQRSSAWWDSDLREKYLFLLKVFIIVVAAILFFLGIFFELTIKDFVIGMLIPVLPLVQLLIKQVVDNSNNNISMTKLKEDLDKMIEEFIQNGTIDKCEDKARTFQDEIYRHRKSTLMIFDWVYNLMRDKQEKQMKFSVSSKINEYKNKNR